MQVSEKFRTFREYSDAHFSETVLEIFDASFPDFGNKSEPKRKRYSIMARPGYIVAPLWAIGQFMNITSPINDYTFGELADRTIALGSPKIERLCNYFSFQKAFNVKTKDDFEKLKIEHANYPQTRAYTMSSFIRDEYIEVIRNKDFLIPYAQLGHTFSAMGYQELGFSAQMLLQKLNGKEIGFPGSRAYVDSLVLEATRILESAIETGEVIDEVIPRPKSSVWSS